MKLQPYPKLKPSGVEWLGDVPGHWQPIALKWVSHRYAGGTPDRSNEAYWDEGVIPWINSGAVNQALIREPSAFITEEGFRKSSARWVPEGALVMALAGQGKTKGMVAQTAIRTTCNQSMAAIVPSESTNPRYLYWLLGSQYEQIRNMAGGEARDGLNLEILGSIPCFKVPEDEQGAIVYFLDRETAKLDMLVEKKRALIGKLKEKRAALISRTVTRGLPPDAARAAGLNPHPKLKPSGVEWIGEVPEHWEVKTISRLTSAIQTGPFGTQLHESDYVEGGIPLINPAHLIDSKIIPDDQSSVDEATASRLSRYQLIVGDVIMGRRGEIGRCSTVTEREKGWLCGTGSFVIRFAVGCTNYFTRIFSSAGFSRLLELNAVGTTMLNLNPTIVGRMRVPAPPDPEQQAIADYLDRETTKIDRMVEKVEAAIERLHEYRSALITAAVTGKIDVRKMS